MNLHDLRPFASSTRALDGLVPTNRSVPIHRRLVLMLLAFSASLASAEQGTPIQPPTDAEARNGRLVGLARAAERHQRKAEAALANGKSLLRGPHVQNRNALKARQHDAEATVRERQRALDELLRRARGNGSDAAAAEAEASRLLTAMPMLDDESRLIAPTPAPFTALTDSPITRVAPNATDLLGTLDAGLSPAVQQQANALGGNPVAIHEWVRRNIRFVPTRGSVQGAAGTLATGMGNATDTASLTVALLRASGIHARYVRGQIELDASRLNRWLGVDRPEAAIRLLTEGGIAFRPAYNGSAITSVTLDHVWVEAFVDMTPSRGARHITGDAWVAMDPSFKDLTVQAPSDLLATLDLDVPALIASIQASAEFDAVSGTLSAIDRDALLPLLDQVVTRLRAAIGEQTAFRTILPDWRDTTPDLPMLMGTYPYRIHAQHPPEASWPDAERARLTLDLAVEDNGLPGPTLLALDQPMPALHGQPLDLLFEPAGDDDRAALATLVAPGTASFLALPDQVPAYLVSMRCRLRLGTTDIGTMPAHTLGQGMFLTLAVRFPDGQRHEQRMRGHVGSNRRIAIAWNEGRAAELAATTATLRMARDQLGQNPDAASLVAQSALGSVALTHLAAASAYQDWLAGLNRVRWHRRVSVTSSYVHLEIDAPYGLILSAQPVGVGLSDVSPNHLAAALDGGRRDRFAQQGLSAQSAFGFQLLEQMVDGGARSATRVFLSSLASNTPVHTWTATQLPGLDALQLPEPVHTSVRAGLLAGDRATFTADLRTLPGWTGRGVLLNYPDGLGGTSFIHGQIDPDAAAHRTGALVSGLNARGMAFAQWLGADTPAPLAQAWQQPAESFLAASDGVVRLSEDPRALAWSPTLQTLVAATVIDTAVHPAMGPWIDQHLWPQLLWPELSIAPLLDPTPPTLVFSVTPTTLVLGQAASVHAEVQDNRPGATVSVTVDGQPLPLDAEGRASVTPTRAGRIPVRAIARDAAGNRIDRTIDLIVTAPNDTLAPQVSITAPGDDAEITKPTDLRGTITDDSLVRWTLTLTPGGDETAPAIVLAEGSQGVTDERLATLDPTMMFNGVYVLTLTAFDAENRQGSDSIVVRLTGDMKLGHFSISFVDAEVPLVGIPIRITRTYDTRQSGESLDFGFGWSVDYQNVRIRESRKMGFSWTLQQQGGGLNPWCVQPSGSPTVSVTLPDGATEEFVAKFEPECSSFVPNTWGRLVFAPKNGKTTTTLEQLDYQQLRWTNIQGGRADLIDPGDPTMMPADPKRYRLTTEEGMVYFLDQSFGVTHIQDPAGNTIQYTHDGITHSNGTAVSFLRDDQDRIQTIVLPDGRRLNYEYDAEGDLRTFRDAGDQPTRFTYWDGIGYPHYLKDLIDARGIRVARNEYNAEGRLTATIDADGKRMEYVHDIAGRVERIKNRRGFETVYVFDDNGWVLSETNALNEQIVRTYDAFGNVLTQTDPLNRTTTYVVDGRGNPLTEEDPTGAITTRTWGAYNNLYTEVDDLQRPVTTNRYKPTVPGAPDSQYLIESKNALDEKTFFFPDICPSNPTSCGNTGNLRSITDANEHTTGFAYDRAGNLTDEVDAEGRLTKRTHDAMGRVKTETRWRTVNGVQEALLTTHHYDARGHLERTDHPDGSSTRSTYDAVGQIQYTFDALNRRTEYVHDDLGRQVKVIHPDGTFDQTDFDEEGNEIARIDRLGRKTRMVYDAANRLTFTIEPDGTPNDDSDNPRTQTVYNKAGEVIETIDARGASTFYEYDRAGRQELVRDAYGRETRHAYDRTGRRESTTDALGRITRFEYDLAGRLKATVYPDPVADDGDDSNNPRTRMEYDPGGRKVAEVDELGRRTEFGYDKLGRLTKVTLAAHTANPLITRYAYDEQGNKTQQIDALQRTTRWTHDPMGRVLTRTLPLGQQESFGYNDAGERTSHTTFNGEQMTYAYDDVGRIDTITFPGNATRTFHYDDAGQVTSIDDRGETYAFQYTERGQLDEATDSEGRRIDYGYDEAGNRTLLTTPTTTTQFTYDRLNRLEEVRAMLSGHPAIRRTAYTYDDVGNRETMTHPNGSTVSYGFDRRNRLTSLLHKTAAGALMLGLAYQVDASGLRTHIDETKLQANTPTLVRQSVYQYDALKRLTHSDVTVPGQGAATVREQFHYDEVGNRKRRDCSGALSTCSGGRSTATTFTSLATTNTYDDNDRLLTESDFLGSYAYAYDDAGNLLTKEQVQGSTRTTLAAYTWDIENRLTAATMTPQGSTGVRTTTDYRYDPNGIRRMSEVATLPATGAPNPTATRSRTDYLVDANRDYAQVLEQWTTTAMVSGNTAPTTLPDPSLQKTYVYGDDLIAEAQYALVATGQAGTTTSAGHDAPAYIGTTGAERIFHYDGLGSTRLLTATSLDADGNSITTGMPQAPANETVTDQYAYTAYGEPDLIATITTSESVYRFTGEQLDPNLGFYYLRERYMDPEQGRFVGMDSYEGNKTHPETLHKYAYAGSNPVIYIDPAGRSAILAFQGASTIQQSLRGTSTASTASVATRIGVKLLMAVGTAAVISSVLNNTATQTRARNELKNKVDKAALALGAASQAILFHYSDREGILGVMGDMCIFSSNAFHHPDGKLRPDGAYATKIPPWAAGLTQRQFARQLFATPGDGWVGHWVAFIQDAGWRPLTGVEWYKPAPAGACVPIIPIMRGPNLMLP